jgi:Flp pilus assembly protein TadD
LYNAKGVKKADEGKFKEAAECFTQAIELAPNDSLSYFNRATVKMNIGDLQGARSDFKLSESFRLSSIR